MNIDPTVYKLLNSDLSHMTDDEAIIHYQIYGKNENRMYKLPDEFDPKIYRIMNDDLRHMTDNEATIHYQIYGKNENRIYKGKLPDDFDPKIYKILNSDLKHVSNDEAKKHYLIHGGTYKNDFDQKTLNDTLLLNKSYISKGDLGDNMRYIIDNKCYHYKEIDLSEIQNLNIDVEIFQQHRIDVGKTFYRMNFLYSNTSNLYIDSNKKIIIKQVNKYEQYNLCARESYIYTLLKNNNIKWCPNIIYNDSNVIVTEYIDGEIINECNIPNDYKNQVTTILNDMNNLGIKHNDIKQEEIIIKNGNVYLCDFGWGTMSNCTLDIFNCEQKPHYITDDSDMLLNIFFKKYFSKKRKTGNQEEIPLLEEINDELKISGYQNFTLNTDKKVFYKNNKYDVIHDTLQILKENCNTLADMGCSAGLVCYIANMINYKNIYAYDHDIEYLNIIDDINKKLHIDNINTCHFSFGEQIQKSDIVCMFALIHWVYSCTSNFGNFDKIFVYLNEYIEKYLLIEWIEVDDGAIKSLGHIYINKNIQKEEYTKENFESSLKKNIGEIVNMINTTNTRVLYVVKKKLY